jgi:hypothetical protein
MSSKATQGTNQGDEEGKGEGATNKWAYPNNDLERKTLMNNLKQQEAWTKPW